MMLTSKATSEGSGCIVLILGLCLAPFLIGIPIIIFAIILMMKTQKVLKCRNCGYVR